MRSEYLLVGCGLCLAVVGCASVTSTRESETDAEGLTYYLPRKDVLITLVVGDNASTTSVVATSSEAYPDLDERFVIRFARNLVGKNELNVTVSPSGLLTTAKSTTTSNLAEVLTDLAGAAGTLGIAAEDTTPAACAQPGTYTRLIELPERARNADATAQAVQAAQTAPTEPEKLIEVCDFCGLTITVWEGQGEKVKAAGTGPHPSTAGLYYRNALPYRVTVEGRGLRRSFLIFSPSRAATQFLPIARTLFANNSATIGLSDGMPISYVQDADGDFIALVKLPAGILDAYFSAIGSTFKVRKGALTDETAYLKAVQDAEVERLKFERCKLAIASKDEAAVQGACAG